MAIEKLSCLKDSAQALIIAAAPESSPAAVLRSFERSGGCWRPAFPAMAAVIGRNGFSAAKAEGDGCSPAGVFRLGLCFGKSANPGTRLAYRQTAPHDCWVDDSRSAWYNTWQTEPARGRWRSAEKLRRPDHLYDYAVVIHYNTDPPVPGKGSAIFLHIWEGPGRGTLGCTALAQDHLLQLIRWLDPAARPLLIQGPLSELAKWQYVPGY